MKKTIFFTLSLSFLFIVSSAKYSKHTDFHTHITHEAYTLSFANPDTIPSGEYPVKKTEAEWKQILTAEQFRILRKGGTELPYVNEYNDNKNEGLYVCAGCGQKLYSSEHKYKSGSGWPSFWQPLDEKYVEEKEDKSWFMTRTEIVCSNCGGHLGHVFDDGPEPTGLRYCMNSAAMKFIAKKKDASDK